MTSLTHPCRMQQSRPPSCQYSLHKTFFLLTLFPELVTLTSSSVRGSPGSHHWITRLYCLNQTTLNDADNFSQSFTRNNFGVVFQEEVNVWKCFNLDILHFLKKFPQVAWQRRMRLVWSIPLCLVSTWIVTIQVQVQSLKSKVKSQKDLEWLYFCCCTTHPQKLFSATKHPIELKFSQ